MWLMEKVPTFLNGVCVEAKPGFFMPFVYAMVERTWFDAEGYEWVEVGHGVSRMSIPPSKLQVYPGRKSNVR